MTDRLNRRRVLLVGGAGFIGHHLALALREQGASVEVVDSLEVNNLASFTAGTGNGYRPELYAHLLRERLRLLREAEVPLHVQDARDHGALAELFDDIEPDVVVHLAAVAHARRAAADPHASFEHGIRTLQNTLDCARGVAEHVIYLSSSMVYGEFAGDAVTEESPCEPFGVYGALKYAGEKLVAGYGQAFALPYTIIRTSALYGERCVSRRVGQVFVENALRGRELRVNDDGANRLDFTYVADLIHGIVRTIRSPAARNEVFNITYGKARSIADLVGVLREHFPDLVVHHAGSDDGAPARGTLSVDKARRLLGYRPAYPLEEGLAAYIDWYRYVLRDDRSLLDAHA